MLNKIDRLIERDNFWESSHLVDSPCVTFGEDHDYYRLLYYLVLEYKPKVALEIGTCDFEGMEKYFNELPGEKRLYKDVLHYGNTMGVI